MATKTQQTYEERLETGWRLVEEAIEAEDYERADNLTGRWIALLKRYEEYMDGQQ